MLCKITYALDGNGNAVHISEVERGLACSCVCPGCGQSLLAKHGDEMGHHFAHVEGDVCKNGYVNSLYYALKRVLDRQGFIALPPYVKNRAIADFSGGIHTMIRRTRVRTDKTKLTQKSGAVTGLIAYCSGKPLVIRLLTAYSEGSYNQSRLKELGLPVVQLDLSREDAIDDDILLGFLSKCPDNFIWLYNARAEAVWDSMLKGCVSMAVNGEQNAIYTMSCPIAANRIDGVRCYVRDKCARCPFFFGLYGFQEDRHILCGRDNLIAVPQDLTLTLQQRRQKYSAK